MLQSQNVFGMVSVTSASRYQSIFLMFIQGLILLNSTELAEAVRIGLRILLYIQGFNFAKLRKITLTDVGKSCSSSRFFASQVRLLKALSHYNVLANVCRRMKYISSALAYAKITESFSLNLCKAYAKRA